MRSFPGKSCSFISALFKEFVEIIQSIDGVESRVQATDIGQMFYIISIKLLG